MNHALDDILVLDLSQGISGPYCTHLLNQQGARTIKIEPPQGDWSRGMGMQVDGQTSIHMAYNKNKESYCLNLKDPQALNKTLQLAQQADIFIENYRPGVCNKLGLSYDELKKKNEKLIYVSICGYGEHSPYHAKQALDTTVQAVSGLMKLGPGESKKIDIYMVDILTAIFTSQLITAALYERSKTGKGKHIQVTMESVAMHIQSHLIIENAINPTQNRQVNPPTGIYQTKDGEVYISNLNDAMFKRLAKVFKKAEWIIEDEQASLAFRRENEAFLKIEINKITQTYQSSELEALLDKHQIINGIVKTTAEAFEFLSDSNKTQMTLNQQTINTPLLPGLVTEPNGSAPRLGEHNDAIEEEFNLK